NKKLVQIVLQGLGPEYDLLVTPIELQPILPTFFVLRAHLLKFEAHTNASSQDTQSSTATAPMAAQTVPASQQSPSFIPQGRECFNNRGRGRYNKNYRGRGRNNYYNNSAPPSLQCQLCWIYGHSARDCRRIAQYVPPPDTRSLSTV